MDRQDVGLLEQLVLRDQGCARGFGGLGRQVLAPGNQVHSESAPDPRDLRSNPPKSQNAQGLSTEICAYSLLPSAGSDGVALRDNISRGGQDQRPGKFDRRIRCIPCMNHCYPVIAGGNDIDRRVYRSRRGNELEIGKTLDDVSQQWGPLTHDTEDVKRQQPLNECLGFGKVVPKYRYIGSIAEHRPIGALKRHVLVVVQNSDLVFFHQRPRLGVPRSTLAFAPRSSAKSKPEEGNLSFMALIRLSGSFAFLSSSSKTIKYFPVKSTAVVESRGASTLLCPGITTDGFKSLIFSNEFNHFSLALLSVSAV